MDEEAQKEPVDIESEEVIEPEPQSESVLEVKNKETSENQVKQEKPQEEPISEEIINPEPATAQIPVNEPLEPEPIEEVTLEPVKKESKPEITETVPDQEAQTETEQATEPVIENKPLEQVQETKPEPSVVQTQTVVIPDKKSKARELLVKARNAIQSRKRKKLDKVMNMFSEKQKITNDEVEKLLHVSDATATRYLSQLEKEGKIKQEGKTGSGVFYTKI